MKARLISTTNHGMSHYTGMEGELVIGWNAHWENREKMKRFHTSLIASYELDGTRLTLRTLNSVYVLEITEGVFDPSAVHIAPQKIVDEEHVINQTRYDLYECKTMANTLSIVRMPYAMTLQEARDYAAYNTVKDIVGDMVTLVLKACTQKDR